jgi:hypothetical protein
MAARLGVLDEEWRRRRSSAVSISPDEPLAVDAEPAGPMSRRQCAP